MHPTAAKVEERLRECGLVVAVHELDASTRTAGEAAAAIDCHVGQIVKSLLFVSGGEPVLCLCAGDHRVDASALGPDARRASADEVRAATGFAIGAVPPLGLDRTLPTVVDASLRRFPTVWCAAGTPHAVFGVATAALLGALAGAEVTDRPFVE